MEIGKEIELGHLLLNSNSDTGVNQLNLMIQGENKQHHLRLEELENFSVDPQVLEYSSSDLIGTPCDAIMSENLKIDQNSDPKP